MGRASAIFALVFFFRKKIVATRVCLFFHLPTNISPLPSSIPLLSVPPPSSSPPQFDSFARVFSGTIKVGDFVKVLGEGYSLEDEEDMTVKQVTRIWVAQARYRVEVNQVSEEEEEGKRLAC